MMASVLELQQNIVEAGRTASNIGPFFHLIEFASFETDF